MFRLVIRPLAALLLTVAALSAQASTLTVYTSRQPHLVAPILDQFSEQTGIKTELRFIAPAKLDDQLQAEGAGSAADLVLVNNLARLASLVDRNLTQPVDEPALQQRIPEGFRDPDQHWFALTWRTRNIFTSAPHPADSAPSHEALSYEALAQPQYRGRVCMRSIDSPFNQGLVAWMIARHGEAETRQWLEGLKANLARQPEGTDRMQIRAVARGECDYAVANSYYLGDMLQDPRFAEDAAGAQIHFPNQDSGGTHLNVSGMVMARHASNPQAARQLMAFLASKPVQQAYAAANWEYPVNPEASPSETLAQWDSFKADNGALHLLLPFYPAAQRLSDEVAFDQ
ncbi:extracellular solute-binding protein [Ferrimonas marina]|uniref:Iron(III) transport system substrate-binding protein n=1 Tax=Ferrimonas marina TaxID=299255 RepID=A0A1M5R472_9GAMM|nr:extracellular solute-binding protein [Ferrimonas marina]SHH20563.1 iron(III) transport system substrate-binding protein [Ferrimonas marina]